MANALYRWGSAAFGHPWRVIVAWLAVVLSVGVISTVVSAGTSNTFEVPGTESQSALEALERTFPEVAGATAQVVVSVPDSTMVSDGARRDIRALVRELRTVEGVVQVLSPYAEGGLISGDERTALVQVQFDVAAAQVSQSQKQALQQVASELTSEGYTTAVGGQAFISTGPGLSPTEALGVVVALLILLVTFRAIVPAVLPVITSVVGVGLATALTMGATGWIDVSSTTPLLGLMVGLAVGIDYALFLVWRYRELLGEGLAGQEAAARANATAGSAVVFAGVTVMTALLALAVPGIPFLRTMGVFAALAVATAVAAAVTLLPAFLGVFGGRLLPARTSPGCRPGQTLMTRLRRGRNASAHTRARQGRWVRAVIRWPAATIVVCVVGLGVLAYPAVDLRLALPDTGSAELGSSERTAYDLISAEFGPGYNAPLLVYADILSTTDPQRVMRDLGEEIAGVPGVAEVVLATPNERGDTGVVVLIPTSGGSTEATANLARDIRDRSTRWEERWGINSAVTGQTAVQIDASARLFDALIPFGLLVVSVCLALLTVVFRSVLIPLSAAAGYLLSVGAAFGAVVAVFEWGWFADVLGVERTGPVISFLPIILMGVLFGLAMDYHIFLVSRMKEDHARGAAAREAVISGFVGVAPVVAAAALIMASVFAAFVLGEDVTVKPIALGLAVGVVVDAFVVRMTLIPAVLALVGEQAWRLPARLDGLVPHVDVEGAAVEEAMELRSWPRPGTPPAVAAQGLTVLDEDREAMFDPVDLTVERGQWLLVEGTQGVGKTSLLLTLAGRMAAFEGRLKVSGHLLPHERVAVRHRVSLAEFALVNPLEEALSVDQHIAERLGSASLGLWVRRRRVDAVRDSLNDLVHDAASATGNDTFEALAGDCLVSQLTPLQRLSLGVALAGLSDPDVIVVDAIDVVRDPDDLDTFWRVLDLLTSPHDVATGSPTGRAAAAIVLSAQPGLLAPDHVRRCELVATRRPRTGRAADRTTTTRPTASPGPVSTTR
ncbi:MMPL family transporter [Nocardioides piscis]|uniref:MMPL family transporter n=1 Tax=Nocardioides piscis TaxID=2714938 RepID=A0A6G7YD72_9ACTN|nr:MMPL family transporter [Nocardioides piscis]QIK74743.1 MMPL family transporter [Nocardioides piscis]